MTTKNRPRADLQPGGLVGNRDHACANGRLLIATVAGHKWMLLVRRLDGTGDWALARFHRREPSGFGLKPGVPNWPLFPWTHRLSTKAAMLCESAAEEPPYVYH